MISGATPVINDRADAPHPNCDRRDPENRCGAKMDAANGPKSTRRPLRWRVALTSPYQEWPANLRVEVFLGRSTGSGRLAGLVVVVDFVFLCFFGIKGFAVLRWCIAVCSVVARGLPSVTVASEQGSPMVFD